MADTFKGIITADGKKRQLPYSAVLETPVSDSTLSKEGGFADSKAVGDKFAKVDSETASLREDLSDEMYCSRYMLTATDYLSIASKYISVNGSVADSENHAVSDYILVLKDDVITYELRGSSDSVALVYRYDLNKSPVVNVAVGVNATTTVSGTYTMPSDGYVRISNRKDFGAGIFQIGDSGKLLGIKSLITESNKITEITSSQDLNSFTTKGKYYTANYIVTNSLSNCPLANTAISLEVDAFSDTYKFQRVIGRDAPFTAYTRIYNGSTFTDWVLGGVDEFGQLNVRSMLTADDVLTDDGKYINYSDGAEVKSANYVTSYMIPVCKNDIIHYDLSGPTGIALVTAYRYDGSFYGTLVNGTSKTHAIGSVTCNGKYSFVKICNRKSYPQRSFYINQSVLLPQGTKTYIDIREKDYIPYYWESNIANAISRYYEKNIIVGGHGLSFVFITDTHTADNLKRSPNLINYLYNHTNVINIVHGGDFIRYSPTEAKSYEDLFFSYLSLFPILGNHDIDASVGANSDNAYSYIFRRYENGFEGRNGFNYYHDFDSEKVRMIFLDYHSSDSVSYLENNVKSEYANIIFNHCYWWSYNSEAGTYTTDSIAEAIANKADALKQNGYDIVAMIVGHIHQDKETTTVNGIPIIATNCDAAGQSAGNGGLVMEGNTTTEQCFDIVNVDTTNRKLYFTRVGAGSDRQFNY